MTKWDIKVLRSEKFQQNINKTICIIISSLGEMFVFSPITFSIQTLASALFHRRPFVCTFHFFLSLAFLAFVNLLLPFDLSHYLLWSIVLLHCLRVALCLTTIFAVTKKKKKANFRAWRLHLFSDLSVEASAVKVTKKKTFLSLSLSLSLANLCNNCSTFACSENELKTGRGKIATIDTRSLRSLVQWIERANNWDQ